MDKILNEKMNQLEWYHTIDLGNGVKTDGVYDLAPYLKYYGLPSSMEGMSAVDIGTASGFFAFEMERRGANPIFATDLPSWDSHDLGDHVKEARPAEEVSEIYLKQPFLFAHKMINSRVIKKEINIYDISKDTIGEFDIVFCGSMLLHITDPIKAMMKIRGVTKKYAIISTQIQPSFFHKNWAKFHGDPEKSVWWFLGVDSFIKMAYSAGFKKVELVSTFDLASRKEHYNVPHAVIRAWKNDPRAEELLNETKNDLINPIARLFRKARSYYIRKYRTAKK